MNPSEPVKQAEWECFRDLAYFDMWCVRKVGETRFGQGFHVPSEAEALALVAELAAANHRADEAEKKLAELDQGFCTCPADWSDGTAYCQNCGKKVGPTQPEQTK